MANPAPGFRNHPEHKITVEPAGGPVKVAHGAAPVASTDAAILLKEDRYPARLYVPHEDITAELTPSEKTTHCPFKGDTVYYHVKTGGETLADAAWSYESPFDEMHAIKGLVAFDDRFEATNG